jgi:PEP-CTERM motif
MKVKSGIFLQTSAMLLVLCGSLCPAAYAGSTVVAYSYAGTLENVSTAAAEALGVANGDYATGTFSYDSAQTGSGGSYTYTGSSKVHTFAVKIYTNSSMTTQLFSDLYSGNVSAFYRNQLTFSSTTGTTLTIAGDTIYKSGLGISGPTSPAFQLILPNPTNAGGFTATNLPNPNPTLIKNFLNISNHPVIDWDPVTPQGTMQSFQVDIKEFVPGLNGVPEPSSVVLAGFGVAACGAGVVVSRRKVGRTRGRRRAVQLSPSLPH